MLARARPYILLFLALTVVYHANLRPVDSGDSLPASLVPFALVLDHSVTLDRFVPWLRGHVGYTRSVVHQSHGHFFSSYPIGAPLLASPLYLPLALAGLGRWDPASLAILARIAQKFAATSITALSAVVLLLLLQRITSAGWAWCLTLVYALATETWSISSQALWQHGPGELAIIACFYCLERWPENLGRSRWLCLCGVCIGVAVAIRPANIVLLPAVLAALLIAKADLRQYTFVLAAPLAVGVILAGYNQYVFHRLSGGYGVALLNAQVLPDVAGLFLSPGRGLLVYTPVAIFALCAFLPGAGAARRRHRLLFAAAAIFALLAAVVITPALTSRSVVWWGGYCWGPRLLTELIPPLIILTAIGASVIRGPSLRVAFGALALYSVCIQAVGVFFYPKGHWDAVPQSVNAAPARLWDWKDNP